LPDNSKRILVTGGAGYIGSHTAHALAEHGYTPIIYDNLCTGDKRLAAGFEFIHGDIADAAKLGRIFSSVDAVMHFAAHAYVGESVVNPQKYFHNNLVRGSHFLDGVLRSHVRKFVFSSSCAIYGVPETVPITEDSPKKPINPYGATKLAFEHALEAYNCAYGLRFAALRYFNAAGADPQGRVGEVHDPETHLIPSALEAIQGRRDAVEILGDDYPTPDGTCIRDYVHVSDLAEAHVLALNYLGDHESLAANLASGRGHSVKEVLATIEQVCGKKVTVRISPRRPGDPPVLLADPAKAKEILGWEPKYSLEDMISTAWQWVQPTRR
jgi:UDP-glucose-4-epimerase GalE